MKLCRLLLMLMMLGIVYCIVLAFLVAPWPCLIVSGWSLVTVVRRRQREFSACGTARWGDEDDLRQAGMLNGRNGLNVGRMSTSPPKVSASIKALFNPGVSTAVACERFFHSLRQGKPGPGPLVTLSNAVHTAVFAPTGVGKGVSCVIPFLLNCDESCVVVDFKGENARLTAGHRKDVFGHQIVMLDPFKVVTQTPDRFNPLEFIAANSPLAIDDARDLAESLVIRTGEEKDPHWPDAAEVWIAGMVAAVVAFGKDGSRSLQTVRDALSNPETREMAIRVMSASPHWENMLARLGTQLSNFRGDELGSTLTTTNRFLRFLDTLAVADSTKCSTFDPANLKRGRMTIYLILPPEHMRAQSALLRMWIGCLLRAVVREGLDEKEKVHFVLDEAASLGQQMGALDDAVDKFRGYGVRCQFYYQSLGQLKKCWKEGGDQTLLANTTQVFFGVNDFATADGVSSRLGEETLIVESGGASDGRSHQSSESSGQGSTSYSRNSNDNWQQQSRRLLKPEEVLALDPRTAIVFAPGIRPFWTTLTRYYEERDLGQPRGSLRRFWSGASMVGKAAVLLALTFGFALWITEATTNLRNGTIPRPMPSVSAGRFGDEFKP